MKTPTLERWFAGSRAGSRSVDSLVREEVVQKILDAVRKRFGLQRDLSISRRYLKPALPPSAEREQPRPAVLDELQRRLRVQ